MYSFLMVFIGGGLGSLCRFGIAQAMANAKMDFPLATLLANVISCLVLGYLFGLTLKNGISEQAKLMWMTGFCGGFSTFSTFSLETFLLFDANANWWAILNVLGSVAVCLACIYVGISLAPK